MSKRKLKSIVMGRLRDELPMTLDEQIDAQKRLDELSIQIYTMEKEYRALYARLHPPVIIVVNKKGVAKKMLDISKFLH